MKEGSKEALKLFLKHYKGNYYTARKLAMVSGFNVYGSQVELRNVISELLEEGCPIISNEKGYCWTEDADQIRSYIDSLNGRIIGIRKRIIRLESVLHELKYIK